MSRPLKLVALFLVALWLPATLHCQLEGLGLDALFACTDQADQSAHTDATGCSDEGCLTIENGQVSLAKSRMDLAALPALAGGCSSCLLQAALPVAAPEISATRQDMTLPLQRTWQFSRRAALPARAPDLVA